MGISANRAAKDRVARGDGRAIPSQNGIRSFTMNTHNQRKLKYVKGYTSHASHSLHSHARDVQRDKKAAEQAAAEAAA